jgi:DNA ligase (NAD+)
MSPAVRVKQLHEQIHYHNDLYFIHNNPEISDQEYDALMHELSDLEQKHPDLKDPNSPTQRVGGEPLEGFRTVTHAVRMTSIDNTYDESEIRAFDQRVVKALDGPTPHYVLEEKVDGIAVNLRYENGTLVLGATRGDGARGDDITANVQTIRDIPRHVAGAPTIMEIRGEIYMTAAEFARLNQQKEKSGEERLANPRNATAGTLKLLDSRLVAKRRLNFIAHGVGHVDPMPVKSYWQWMQLVKHLGIPIAHHAILADTIDQVIDHIEKFATIRHTLPYQTDGIVVKIDDFAQRDLLGFRSKAPRWAIAYKYQPDQVETILLDVIWNVGKLGTLTPVADLDPVLVAGTTVKRASLHNIEQIQRLDIRIGDHVIVEKAGEIIPQVVRAVPEKRPRDAKAISPPTKCPSCGSTPHQEPDTPHILCINPACPAQIRGRLRWFAARGQMNVEHLGESLIDQLVEHKLVQTFADIFRLKKEQLTALERMADKSAQNVIDGIAASRDRSLDRLLAGLNISHVGTHVAQVLAKHFGSLAALEKATVEELTAVHEIGEVIAQSVFDFFHEKTSLDAVHQLIEVGINPKMTKPAAADLPLAGQSIVVTGTLENYSREEIEELITKLGGRASGSVSKKTAFLIAGTDAGSKLDKAKELNVKVVTEQEFASQFGRYL